MWENGAWRFSANIFLIHCPKQTIFTFSFHAMCFNSVRVKYNVCPVNKNCVCWESHSSILIIVFGSLKTKHDQPVDSCGSLTGAVDGPCSGHLALSQVTLVEEALVEGQVNSLPWLMQTWAVSPGCVCVCVILSYVVIGKPSNTNSAVFACSLPRYKYVCCWFFLTNF